MTYELPEQPYEVMRLHADGRITTSERAQPTEAAKLVLACMEQELKRLIAEAVAAERERLAGLAGEPVGWAQKNHEYFSIFPDKYHTEALHTADQLAAAIVRAEDAVRKECEAREGYLMHQQLDVDAKRITELESQLAACKADAESWRQFNSTIDKFEDAARRSGEGV